jgi:hypothetical protein
MTYQKGETVPEKVARMLGIGPQLEEEPTFAAKAKDIQEFRKSLFPKTSGDTTEPVVESSGDRVSSSEDLVGEAHSDADTHLTKTKLSMMKKQDLIDLAKKSNVLVRDGASRLEILMEIEAALGFVRG